MSKTLARQKVSWCNRSIEWIAIAVEDKVGPMNAMWSYRMDGLTYFSFPFDPTEDGFLTRARALNWLNRHHLIIKREHLGLDIYRAVR
jgi:hypothetical protein